MVAYGGVGRFVNHGVFEEVAEVCNRRVVVAYVTCKAVDGVSLAGYFAVNYCIVRYCEVRLGSVLIARSHVNNRHTCGYLHCFVELLELVSNYQRVCGIISRYLAYNLVAFERACVGERHAVHGVRLGHCYNAAFLYLGFGGGSYAIDTIIVERCLGQPGILAAKTLRAVVCLERYTYTRARNSFRTECRSTGEVLAVRGAETYLAFAERYEFNRSSGFVPLYEHVVVLAVAAAGFRTEVEARAGALYRPCAVLVLLEREVRAHVGIK